MIDDREQVEAVWRGETEAFAPLVHKYQAPLVAAAYQFTRHAEDAQDLAQEALLEAYRCLGQLREPEKFRGWLFIILRHKCRRKLRHRRWEELPLDACREIPAPPQASADEELAAALIHLPLADREVLAARYLYELDYEEVAHALGINVRAAYMRCQRARGRLRTLLLQGDEEETGRTLRRVTSALTIGLTGDAFVKRVLQEVKPIELTLPHPSSLPKPPAALLHGTPQWLPAIGCKIAAMAVIACVLAGSSSAPRVSLPAITATAVQAQTKNAATETLPPPATKRAAQPVDKMPAPLLLADAATPEKASPTTARQMPATETVPAATPAVAPPAMVLQFGNVNRVRALAVSPDGTRLATLGADNAALIWDLASGALQDRVPNVRSETGTLTFSQDSRRLLISGDVVQPPIAWDIAEKRGIPIPKTLTGDGRFTADGKEYWQYTLVEQDKDNELKSRSALKLWNLAGGRLERTVPGLTGELLDISRDNTRAVTLTGTPWKIGQSILGANDAELIVEDLTTGKEITRLKGLNGYLSHGAALFSPDGNKFAAACTSFNKPADVLVWDTHTGVLLQSLNQPLPEVDGVQRQYSGAVQTLAFSADGAMLAAGGQAFKEIDQQAIVWDVASGKIMQRFRHDDDDIATLAFTPDGSQLVTGATSQGKGGAIRLWEVPTGKLVRTFTGVLRQLDIRTFAVSAYGKLMATGSNDQIAIWDVARGCVRSILPLPDHAFPTPWPSARTARCCWQHCAIVMARVMASCVCGIPPPVN